MAGEIKSPNVNLMPATAGINKAGHLTIAGLDTVDLAETFGTPLWLMDEETLVHAAQACQLGLKDYPQKQVLYAGKAFLCLAMCRLIEKLGLGLDVVSEGELFTAQSASFPAQLIYMHGNNKSAQEIKSALNYGAVKIVADGLCDLNLIAKCASELGQKAAVLLRLIPGVEPDTHHYIQTGHDESKFGIAPEDLPEVCRFIKGKADCLDLIGLHAHIGSQSHDLAPYQKSVCVLAQCFKQIKDDFQIELSELDLGGGLGIAYREEDKPTAIYDWAKCMSDAVLSEFKQLGLSLPKLLLEPGRAIVGTSGITLYRAGSEKFTKSGRRILSVDGGMADNPRPVTYQAIYTAKVANKMLSPERSSPGNKTRLAGRFCESGDILIDECQLEAQPGDLIAVFATGAYNYSMSSNYNRSTRPACLLLHNGQASVIIEREMPAELIRNDRLPAHLQSEKSGK